jgi:rhodanese-related sulfurtransferase
MRGGPVGKSQRDYHGGKRGSCNDMLAIWPSAVDQYESGTVIRALLIAMVFASIGVVANRASDDPVPWVYAPPSAVVLAGVTVQLIDEREAAKFLDDPGTVFVDSRTCPDYAKSHVRGAVCLPPEDVEHRFPAVEPLIPSESRVILYCYGPECDMAEKVGEFLAQMGYRNLLIMSSGFPAWVKAKFPIDGRTEQDTAVEGPEDIFMEEEIGDEVIASRRFCRCRPLLISRS